ncbi:MAG: HD domain-containing protein [Syntrophomonadaceae bacterium]|nr:HD domain-containing protein [Syntrophomonadaceae bacterium]
MRRIELLLNNPLYQEYMNYNEIEEAEPKFCRHDISHHIDVARIAYILVLEQNDLNFFIKESNLSGRLAAKEVIYAAGLLHDIGKWKEYRTGIDHSSFGAKLARDILPQVFFNPNEVEIIARAIYEHRNLSMDMSFLGERIYRADNLARICINCIYRKDCPKLEKQEINTSTFEY